MHHPAAVAGRRRIGYPGPMPHRMQVFVAKQDVFRGVIDAITAPQGYGVVELGPAVRALWGGIVSRPIAPFEHLDQGALRFVIERSYLGPIAWLEATYFGAMGTQAAAVWGGGVIVQPGRRFPEEGLAEPPWGDPRGPINEALGQLGVDVGDARDAFDALELWRFSRGAGRADPRGLG